MPIKKSKKGLSLKTIALKLITHMNEGVWVGDKHERTVYANPRFCEMTGYSLDEMIGQESYIFWDKESAERVRDVNTRKRKKGISSSYEGNLLNKSGEKIPVLLSGTPLPDGGTIGIMTDLTSLKQKEAKEKILTTAIRFATDVIVVFNSDGEIASWNKGAKIVFGYKQDEMVGEKIYKVLPEEEIRKYMNQAGATFNVELGGTHRNNSHIKIAATLTPIFGEDKKGIEFYLLIGRDITSQMKFEDELTVKYQKMKDAYNQLGVVRRQMDYIFEILDLFGSRDRKSITNFIVSSIIMLTRADACVLRLFNEKKGTLDLLSSFGVSDAWQGKKTIKYKNSLIEKAYNLKTPLRIVDLARESRHQSINLAKKHNFSSLLLIPLQFNSRLVGSLSLYTTPEKKLEILENEFIEKYAKLIEVILAKLI